MSRRPAIRKSDLNAALAAALALGLRPRSVRFHADGGFHLDFSEAPAAANDDVEQEIAAFEESHR